MDIDQIKKLKKLEKISGNCDIYLGESNNVFKILRNTSKSNKIKRFNTEISICKILMAEQIPGMVKVLSIKDDEESALKKLIELKKYDGDLNDFFDLSKNDVKRTIKLILPIIEGLRILSQKTPFIVHRDIKPANILYEKESDSLFLTDFGIGYVESSDRVTNEAEAVGARLFMAPEYETMRVEDVNEKGDIFSFGKILWFMINGENTIFPLNLWFLDKYNLSLKQPNNDIFKIVILISKCLEIDPVKRPTYDEIIQDMKKILNDNVNPEFKEKDQIIAAMRKKEIEDKEILEKNKNLVNFFSSEIINALKTVKNLIGYTPIIDQILNDFQSRKQSNGNFWTVNVVKNSEHYLFTNKYNDIYITFNYHSARSDEKYCNIDASYSIKSGKSNKIVMMYENNDVVVIYENKKNKYTREIFVDFIKTMIKQLYI